VGKNQIDEAVRDKRSRMKLVISTSQGQAWLINHPSRILPVTTHSVFFTESSDNESLQHASSAIFSSWYMQDAASNNNAAFSCPKTLASRDLGELVVGAIDRLMTGGISHDSYAFAQLTPRDIRAAKRAKRTPSADQSVNQDGTTAIPSHQSPISDSNIENDDTSPIVNKTSANGH
jgi:hypothetical protein